MVVFDLWREGIILFGVYTVIVAIPCVFLAVFGRRVLEQLGHHPTQADMILRGPDFLKFVGIGFLSLMALGAFYFVLMG